MTNLPFTFNVVFTSIIYSEIILPRINVIYLWMMIQVTISKDIIIVRKNIFYSLEMTRNLMIFS